MREKKQDQRSLLRKRILLVQGTLSPAIGNLSLISLSSAKFPPRPAFGTQGSKVTLWANYFEVDFSATDKKNVKANMSGTLYEYTLTVTGLPAHYTPHDRQEARKFRQVHDNLKDTMFYV